MCTSLHLPFVNKKKKLYRILRRFLGVSAAVIFTLQVNYAFALSLIRDAEIEHSLRLYSDPIFKAAGINDRAVNIFIVQDDALNAYVAGGANMFLNTGLIMAAETPDVLLGVIAHETGHIAGGHLAQGTEKIKNAQIGTILTYVLGATAAVVSKKPEAAAAVIGGGQGSIARNILSYTRANEQAADQSALTSLDKLGISSQGMLKMFEILERNERKRFGSVDPYMLTHPLTGERVEFVKEHVKKSGIPLGKYPKKYDKLHQRMVAKLYGFLQPPKKTLQKYPVSDKSVAARLARSVAYYRIPDIDKSLKEINGLIEEFPKDPFFHELKGQILFENAKVEESLKSYLTAINLLPNSALILADLGKVEISLGTDDSLQKAISHLEKSVTIDASHSNSWRLLAMAYGKKGNYQMSNLALAEEALLKGDYKTALQMVEQTMPKLDNSSPAFIRAGDIKNKAKEMEKESDEGLL